MEEQKLILSIGVRVKTEATSKNNTLFLSKQQAFGNVLAKARPARMPLMNPWVSVGPPQIML